jgi:hypothetical protein
MKMFFSGFFESSYILYNFKQNDPKKYVTDFQENVKLQSLNRGNQTLENKVYFAEIVKNHVLTPKTLGFIFNGLYYPLSNGVQGHDFFGELQSRQRLMLKQIDGDGGLGIFRIDYDNGNFIINNKPSSFEDVNKLVKSLDRYFISDVITQTGYASKIYPRTVNTVRFVTMMSPETKEPFIAAVAHRIGNNGSFPVDNCAKGGFTARVCPETGTLSKAITTKVYTKDLNWITHHPDTGSPIEGVVIPNWDKIKNKILDIASLFPFLPCVGWDVVIQEDSQMYILEGNNSPDLKLHQVHEPLLANEKVKAFYEYYINKKN